MRAGPLSNTKVIAMLNRYYVPVYSSNEYAGPDGTGPPALSRKLLTNFYPQRIFRAPTGTVLSYSGCAAL
ncbi:MAG: hypothetical protein DMG57_21075 [Acidobacteria bacterium]|nr:MAG: hypothetical protein DMG57_21075 [Acidobacteriota bacterium]